MRGASEKQSRTYLVDIDSIDSEKSRDCSCIASPISRRPSFLPLFPCSICIGQRFIMVMEDDELPASVLTDYFSPPKIDSITYTSPPLLVTPRQYLTYFFYSAAQSDSRFLEASGNRLDCESSSEETRSLKATQKNIQ